MQPQLLGPGWAISFDELRSCSCHGTYNYASGTHPLEALTSTRGCVAKKRVGTCLALNNVPSACVISRTNVLNLDKGEGVRCGVLSRFQGVTVEIKRRLSLTVKTFFLTLKRVSKMSYCSLKTGLDASDVLVSDPGFLRRCRTLSHCL
ncbi:hypothetical protein FOCG_01710 [Fusarium oxysporum f. sp. radicis-lycopersici 26381]|uniref:Uncharacterized protein n=1 Tax=Fusarium oxysporum Fo47 TaxID=660027 RepID=W9KNN3_FUSOX|nr:hypothetical protein FOZG_06205 [Fusarium oxysporum Fo47]EWZ79719.1 hypothetical protein FOWG_16223 [Fusarium oxysporum f. sp. lycopersici MN25]EXL63367.1 hypothetical protein FOCG_01710 [Fusarium oxysporum f. sp. radicis-lycopersici 26381]EWZ46014.1 hypothetical protein FOZG_06205 [Fusarium oxysporum Fo47]EWZ46015.1 hypothetical protein FOZG_06205 [Fusarium oxysporum Fo47]